MTPETMMPAASVGAGLIHSGCSLHSGGSAAEALVNRGPGAMFAASARCRRDGISRSAKEVAARVEPRALSAVDGHHPTFTYLESNGTS